MAAKTFSNEDLYGQYCKIKNTYGIKISGIPLDDETQDIITFEMQENLQSIICLIMSLSEPVLWTELIRLSFLQKEMPATTEVLSWTWGHRSAFWKDNSGFD